jgi:chromosome segregation ATPase
MRFLVNAFVIVFALAAIGIAVKFYQNSVQAARDLNKERYDRMVAEEKLTNLDARVNSLEIDLARSQNESESSQRRLNEIRKEAEAVKSQIDVLNKQKQELESKLNGLQKQPSSSASVEAVQPVQ